MPVYYYNWPAQLKAVVDRFYSFTGELEKVTEATGWCDVVRAGMIFENVSKMTKRTV